MDFASFFVENFKEKEYEKYMSTWLNGIISEIDFWNDYVTTGGSMWKAGFKKTIAYERSFSLEAYLDGLEKTVVLDVGSGPFSCGSKTEKTALELHAVDPLAFVYKKIKDKYGIRTRIQPEFAMVEKLYEKYAANTFNIVHMRNALDHSFNPIMGLLQMLYICKVGGKVILIHRDDEAEFENYGGFHQWNLKVEGDSFIIWRGSKKYNIADLFGDCIELKTVSAKSREDFHEVIMLKKKETGLVADPLLEIYHRKLFNKLLECLMDRFYEEKKEAERTAESILYRYKKKVGKLFA